MVLSTSVVPRCYHSGYHIDDFFWQWNSGWPVALTTDSAESSIQGLASAVGSTTFDSEIQSALNASIGSFSTDQTYISGLASVSGSSKTYMAAVSPWFFTHYPASSWNKNVSEADTIT